MAPLPDNNTLRVRIRYTSGGVEHSMITRPHGVTDASVAAVATNALTALLAPLMANEDAIVGADCYLAGEDFSTPMTVDTPSGSAGSVTPNDQSNAAFASWVGRSTGGRRAKLELFTQAAYSFNATRVAIGVISTVWADVYDYLSTDANAPAAIDGEDTLWKAYVNFKRSAYWQAKLR